EYLISVLEGAIRLLQPGGHIFVGDVRHLGLLHMFHSAVQFYKASPQLTVGQLRKRVAKSAAQDAQLLLDPQFFDDLPGRIPGICAVTQELKRGKAANELTGYRYDVILTVDTQMGTKI